MITFLFWNSKNESELVGRLVAEHRVDVLILAESEVGPERVVVQIQKADGARFSFDPWSRDVAIFTRFPATLLRRLHTEPGFNVRLIPSEPEDILLAAVHLRSKRYTSDAEQASLSPVYAQAIRREEDRLGHRRTVLVGDLNMNPFDHGVIQATGFHAVPSREVAGRGERLVAGQPYPFFYNPMWNFFGDARGGPPGTYYYDRGNPITYYWNIFDQVLVRPELLRRFVHRDLRILSECGPFGLLDPVGRPRASDHLPILFRLDLEPPGERHVHEGHPEPHPSNP